MPHPLPVLAVLAAVPVLALATHATTVFGGRPPAAHAAALLPNNLCASCHGGGRVASVDDGTLGAGELVATRSYLQRLPRG